MADFVEFAFADGTRLSLQAFAPPGNASAAPQGEPDGEGADAVPGFGTSRPVARGARVVAAAEGALSAVLAPLVPMLQQVHDTVAAVPDAPDELSVSFGLRVSQDLKLAVVGTTGEASMTITANWLLSAAAPGDGTAAGVDAPTGHANGAGDR
ncbi:CU044_2847 family protein [Streptomyces sp. H51]|uniref:CU044_2847 family protein n=1 Tax=Streptomyces sp. H51 TaxID=3111770 RepID=UPI002D76709B|nr:CU044_2847 family protein [Streptomyces sp. H51]